MAELKNFNGHFCESEYAFIDFLENEGWTYTHGNNIPRQNKNDVLIQKDFLSFIASTNPDLTENEVGQIFDTIRLVGADHDLDIDYEKEMARIQAEMKEILCQEKKSQQMLEDAFKGIGYGIE